MIVIPINALRKEDGDLLILLSDEQERAYQKAVDAAPKGKDGQPPKEPTPDEQLLIDQADFAVVELEAMRLIKENFPESLIRSKWHIRESEGADQIRASILRRKYKEAHEDFADLDEIEDQALLAEMSYQVLKPVAIEGWEGEPHRRMKPILVNACYQEMFYFVEEERYRFLIDLPQTSSSSS